MRKTYHAQLALTSVNEHARPAELREMSAALDANAGVLRRVHADLLQQRKANAKLGREGMTAEQVVRASAYQADVRVQLRGAFLSPGDSLVLRGFCRFSPAAATPKRSTLQANMGAIRPETWEAMNKALVLYAREQKIEDGRWMRTDTTVVESNIHHPSTRRSCTTAYGYSPGRSCARTKYGATAVNHRRRAKRRAIAIVHVGRMDKRVPLYKDLLKITHKNPRVVGALALVPSTGVRIARPPPVLRRVPLYLGRCVTSVLHAASTSPEPIMRPWTCRSK
jgi:IS5 family transposase